MKHCPFCKQSVQEKTETCPHCNHILIERINNPAKRNLQSLAEKAQYHAWTYLHDEPDKVGEAKWKRTRKYILVVGVILFIIALSQNPKYDAKKDETPISVIPQEDNTPETVKDVVKTDAKKAKDYVSLSNGTILSKNASYLNGLGELKIDNGTSSDAIAKLVNLKTDKSIATVYIKSKSIYTFQKISDGNYKLLFNIGNDWDTEIKAFMVNSTYSVFEEAFDFTTKESIEGNYINTKYSKFEVTLHPVVSGDAKTDEVSAIEFASY